MGKLSFTTDSESKTCRKSNLRRFELGWTWRANMRHSWQLISLELKDASSVYFSHTFSIVFWFPSGEAGPWQLHRFERRLRPVFTGRGHAAGRPGSGGPPRRRWHDRAGTCCKDGTTAGQKTLECWVAIVVIVVSKKKVAPFFLFSPPKVQKRCFFLPKEKWTSHHFLFCQVVRQLLEARADQAWDGKGRTPLLWSAAEKGPGYVEVAKLLLGGS